MMEPASATPGLSTLRGSGSRKEKKKYFPVVIPSYLPVINRTDMDNFHNISIHFYPLFSEDLKPGTRIWLEYEYEFEYRFSETGSGSNGERRKKFS